MVLSLPYIGVVKKIMSMSSSNSSFSSLIIQKKAGIALLLQRRGAHYSRKTMPAAPLEARKRVARLRLHALQQCRRLRGSASDA